MRAVASNQPSDWLSDDNDNNREKWRLDLRKIKLRLECKIFVKSIFSDSEGHEMWDLY